jgi:hypothetical protein
MNRLFQVASLLTAMALTPGMTVLAQAPAAAQSPQPGATAQVPGGDRLSPSELEELLGPIALYPDPLLANVLAAACYPEEVAAAAKFIGGGGKPEQIESQTWEPPVKAIAKVPEAIKIMGEYADWTVALGQAYLLQSKDVMDVIQGLRKKAQANGALQTNPQQKVVVEQETVYIKPADPEVIYVPTYSPSVVYVEEDHDDAFWSGVIGFGAGVATGLILANNLDCDWHGGCVGWGWGGGGWGDVDVDIDRNIQTGDINIGNRTNIGSGNRVNNGNRVGNEGNAWSPNRNKVNALNQPNRTNEFRSGANAANRARVPGGGGTAAANRPNAGAGAAQRPGGGAAQRPGAQPIQRPAAQPAGPAQRPGAQPAGPAQRPGAAQQPARPGNTPAARPNVPAQRPASPSASRVPPTPPRQSAPSAFSGGRDTAAASQRGAASRSQSSSSAARSAPSRSAPSRSAPSRSAGGGAARSGGGGGRR